MALRIRMSRQGAKKRPFYRIVIADSRSPRDGKFLEIVGTYNPMLPKDAEKRVVLVKERLAHWIKMGATASERVQWFLHQAGMGDKPVIQEQPKKSAPKTKAQERAKAKAEAAAKAGEAKAEATA